MAAAGDLVIGRGPNQDEVAVDDLLDPDFTAILARQPGENVAFLFDDEVVFLGGRIRSSCLLYRSRDRRAAAEQVEG